jgi:hypothetical protein
MHVIEGLSACQIRPLLLLLLFDLVQEFIFSLLETYVLFYELVEILFKLLGNARTSCTTHDFVSLQILKLMLKLGRDFSHICLHIVLLLFEFCVLLEQNLQLISLLVAPVRFLMDLLGLKVIVVFA